jgi:hypothetical protein
LLDEAAAAADAFSLVDDTAVDASLVEETVEELLLLLLRCNDGELPEKEMKTCSI